MPVHSILWIGPAEALARDRVAEAPTWEVAWARDLEDAVHLPLASFDAVLLDCDDARAAREALERLRALPEAEALPPLLVRLARGKAGAESGLCAAGARRVLRRGPEPTHAEALLRACLEEIRAGGREGPPSRAPEHAGDPAARLVSRSGAMREVIALVERAARSSATVLLLGETGSGKEVLARAIHGRGPRRSAPFVAVNCAAFPETLLESELFGHAKGAFTGADRARPGLFREAHRGTLLLDEVGETSPSCQAKLLRALQEREVRPLGSARPHRVDVRLIAATNRDLRAEVRAGRLREDLYYRLAVFPITVPPLRRRREDILPLAELFLRRYGSRDGRAAAALAPEAADLLLAHPWPGNVRELENEMQHALALTDPGTPIRPEALSEGVRSALEPVAAASREGETLHQTLARIEAWLIRRALAAHDGRRAATARTLGLTREGLYKKMKRLGIE